MRSLVRVAILAAGLAGACQEADFDDGLPCGGSACGYLDHRYDSTFYCPPLPLIPSGWHGYTWRSLDHCHAECDAAAAWGCNASACDAGCEIDHGSGSWVACTEANGGVVTSGGCYLAGSGVSGETVPCVCR